MKLIKQKHENGCGIACVAMIGNLSYNKAIKIVYPNGRPKKITGTNIIELQCSLFELNLITKIYSPRVEFKIQDLKNDAILCYQDRPGAYHAIVWNAELKKIFDPTGRARQIRTIRKTLNLVCEIKRP